MRMFVAVALPETLRRALGVGCQLLRSEGIDHGLRWVRPESMHLTLLFLGERTDADVDPLLDALRTCLADAPSFVSQPQGLGTFEGGPFVHT